MNNNIYEAERAIGYEFNDKSLLNRALTAPSASENNNQRLEFFGDAILEFIVSEQLYGQGGNEGELTEKRTTLVSDEALRPVSTRLGLNKLLLLGKYDGNNKKAVPSVYEAVVAAIYLDGGMEKARQFVLSTLNFSTEAKTENYKGELQELLQGDGIAPPEYESTDIGNAQKHRFQASVIVFGKAFTGEADRKSQAEQFAAKSALEYLRNKGIR